jgi:hypothetical protein
LWLTAWAYIESQHHRVVYIKRDETAANQISWF